MINLLCLIMLVTPAYTPETLPSEAGVYEVSITYDNGLKTRSKVTVMEGTTTQSTKIQEVYLDASDFYVTSIDDLDKQKLIDLANVKIWNAETGEYYDIVDVTYSGVSDSLFLVNFYQSEDVFITVRMYLLTDEQYRDQVLPKEYGMYSWEQVPTTEEEETFTVEKTVRFVLYTLSTIHLVMIAVIVLNARSLAKRNIDNLKMFDESINSVKKN